MRTISCDSCGKQEQLQQKVHKPLDWVKVTLTWKHVGSTGRPSKVLYYEICSGCAEALEHKLGEGAA